MSVHEHVGRVSVLSSEDRAVITRRAVAAAVTVARAHGLRVEDPVVLADGYAVRVHLRPAPVVARVSTYTAVLRAPIGPWLARELAVAGFLAGQGAPVVPPSELVPPGPHEADGFGISFWRYVAPVSTEVPAPAVAGRMLGELHAALRGYQGALPTLAPPLTDIRRGLVRIERQGDVLAVEELALLQALADRLLPQLEAAAQAGPVQALHGDAHGLNLIATAGGLLWNDFEDVCRGPIEWDLSTLADPGGELLRAYPGAPSEEALALYRQVRLLHGAVFVFALQPERDEWAAAARGLFDQLRAMG